MHCLWLSHTWGTTPANWESLGHPPAGTTIDLYIALKPHCKNALIGTFLEAGNPGHPKHILAIPPLALTYGAYLSKEQLGASHPHTLELVNSWLEHHGITSSSVSRTHGGGWFTVSNVLCLKPATSLLLHISSTNPDIRTTVTILRTVGYALRVMLYAHVRTVAPTTYFGPSHMLQRTPRKRSRGEVAAMEEMTSGEPVMVLSRRGDDEIEPSFLHSLHQTEAYVSTAKDRNALGVVGFVGSDPSQKDLTTFMSECCDDPRTATFNVEQVNCGGNDPSHCGSEADQNIQYTEAMAWKDEAQKEPFQGDAYLKWFNYIITQTKIPQTIIISYGSDEHDLPQEYAMALCKLFAESGAFGISVLFASGNQGIGGGPGGCKDQSGKDQISLAFPGSCPWVTSVGGAMDHDPDFGAEFARGGFSLFFAPPPYQEDVITAFLWKLGSKSSIPGSTSRARCSPPAAGIISLLNDDQLSLGKTALGFLNPLLYGSGLK
ncbi:peptidase S8/S53 domain-containing protein [Lactarius deliciosus]|nr:peptidase S8/S53 domain-containing protein [Lactarius deliciosus]